MFNAAQNHVITLAQQAGDAIMKIYKEGAINTQIKEDGSPITRADMAAHKLICEGLKSLGLPVLSEESAELSFATRASWQRYYLVDPLDGTKEFINRTDEFTVNIALIENHEPVFGVVYAPALDEMYAGGQSIGAFKRISTQDFSAISVRQRSVCDVQPLVVVGSRRHGAEKLAALLQHIPHEMNNRGSALKICQVAEGVADFYPRLGPTSEWDTAAGQAIVEAAGGELCTTQFERLRYNQKDSLLNPEFFVFGGNSKSWRDRLVL